MNPGIDRPFEHTPNRVQHPGAAWFQEPSSLSQVIEDVLSPDMLEHSDTHNLIDPLLLGHLAVVLQPNVDAVPQAQLCHPRRRFAQLLFAEGDANYSCAPHARGMDSHPPPSTAYVEQQF